MTRRAKIALSLVALAILAIIATPSLIYHFRNSQLDAAKALVAANGGTLGLDLVDGNYMLDLHGTAATDETLAAILPTLRQLPNGFTLLGPGESRLFYVTLMDSSISDDGMRSLCTLPISCLSIDCPELTDASVDSLSSIDEPYVIISGSAPFSDDAIERLRNAKPNTMLQLSTETSGEQ
ncbi:hypothetical protein Poly51_11690 [Rubripirellula tenax]|uniref:Uncharacterized protein n=1 Tax=Rubripirellula tenax TaxID=2528015 RepID=A0A5C6FLJ6_9BACT|nr:hypothetical protein [Rubripirellula tenax]TWU60887.1 hypothetical protein Poly51_11690 [Rubripirellula tenax]